jgi:ABC-type sugar transport system ATPase subunit
MVPSALTAPYLHIDGVMKRYGSAHALRGVSFGMERGSFVALLGPSGCGKTTLLRIIAGLLDPDGGRLVLGGDDVTAKAAWDRDIGLVFQNYALFPHMSVADNVAFGLRMRKAPDKEVRTRVAEALESVRLIGFDDRMPAALSGGQQQRVAIARAIAIGPRLLLLDEPLSNLDAVLRASVRAEIRDLHDRTGVTTIMVTHDQAEALTIADQVVLMSEGRIVQHDTPEALYTRPASAFAASFVGGPPAALLRVDPRLGLPGWSPAAALAARLAATPPGDVLLALRPEALSLAPKGTPGALPGRLKRIEFLGADRIGQIEVGGQKVLVRLGAGPAPDDPELAVVLSAAVAIFSADTGLPIDAI